MWDGMGCHGGEVERERRDEMFLLSWHDGGMGTTEQRRSLRRGFMVMIEQQLDLWSIGMFGVVVFGV
jgi:hypothetical protein